MFTPNTNDYPMPLNEPPRENFLRTPLCLDVVYVVNYVVYQWRLSCAEKNIPKNTREKSNIPTNKKKIISRTEKAT